MTGKCSDLADLRMATDVPASASGGRHQAVLGARKVGLFAAQALLDFYEEVTVVERDTRDDEPWRRGTRGAA